jgi:hypothetical protein
MELVGWLVCLGWLIGWLVDLVGLGWLVGLVGRSVGHEF